MSDVKSSGSNETTSGNLSYDLTSCMKELSMKENIFYGSSPYMPILLENIPDYVKLKDFEFECVKEIQTIGILIDNENKEGPLLIHPEVGIELSIKLSFRCLTEEYLVDCGYSVNENIPCKVYGRLICHDGKPLIEVHHLSKTDDLQDCLKTTFLLSQLVRKKYHYYTCSRNPEFS